MKVDRERQEQMKKGSLENKEIKVEKRKKRKKDGYKEEGRKNND